MMYAVPDKPSPRIIKTPQGNSLITITQMTLVYNHPFCDNLNEIYPKV